MPRSEIAEANAIVAAVTHLLDLVHEEEQEEVLLRTYADEDAFRLAHPEAEHIDNALHGRIVRTAARAAHRIGCEVSLLRLRAAPMRAWLAAQPAGVAPEAYPGETGDTISGDAALRALGLNPAELKQAPRKPAQGPTLAARIARYATDPEAEDDLIVSLTEELLAQRLDGALGVAERMLEPEDFAFVRHEIDLTASTCVMGEKGRERDALLFVSPVLRDGAGPFAAEVPAGLQARLTGIALDASFVELILAPFWVPTSALPRLRPSDLREAAEALANGLEPTIPRAGVADRDVCLLGLTLPMAGDGRADDDAEEEDEDADPEEAGDRVEAWLAVVADAAGGGRAEPPVTLARALDLLRRVKLAVPDDDWGDEAEPDEDEPEVDEALVVALVGHLAGMGNGMALLMVDEAIEIRVVEGAIDMELEPLARLLFDGLLGGGLLFVVPAAEGGKAARGHAFLLRDGEAEGLSAADAAAAFADDGPEGWADAPAGWDDAPALDYDPAIQ
jgi:hypothetical protein